jgi:hypothetical protein
VHPRGSRAVRRAALVAAGLALPVAAVESVARFLDAREAASVQTTELSPGYYRSHDVLGFAPSPNSRSTGTRVNGRDTVYSVTYTIDGDGLRVGPEPRSTNPADCVLFFGDSFTYGEGVADRETIPYVVGVLSGYRIYNFAYHGYGPHQMLAAIEQGMVSRVVRCQPRTIVYAAIADHPWRAAGQAPWDQHGPRFVLGKDGPIYTGPFDAAPPGRPLWERVLRRSHAYRLYVAARVTDNDIALFAAIVAAARDRLHALYPSASFHVILWDAESASALIRREAEALQHAGITPQLASAMLPGYAKTPLAYELGPTDHHPNAATDRLVAQFVVDHFLGQ